MNRVLLISALIMAGCQPVDTPASNADLCEQTVRDYGPLRDNGPADVYADLFIEDGTFQLGNTVTKGREALIARHVASNKASRWRHNMTDIRISDSNPITGVTRFNIYVGPAEAEPAIVVREIIGEYMDTFQIENGRCKIASRKVKIVFDSLR